MSSAAGGVYEGGPSWKLDAYRNSCWHLESSVRNNGTLQSRGWSVIPDRKFWRQINMKYLKDLERAIWFFGHSTCNVDSTQKSQESLFHCSVSMGV